MRRMTAGEASAPSIAEEPQPRALGIGFFARLAGLSAKLERLADAERDQLPLWLPVGLGLGTALWFWLPGVEAWTAFLLLAAALALAPLAVAPDTRWARACATFALAALLGCANIWWKAERVAEPVLTHERLATFVGEVETLQRLPAREAVRIVVKVS